LPINQTRKAKSDGSGHADDSILWLTRNHLQDMLVAGLNRIFIENRRPPLHSKLGFLDPNYQVKEHDGEYEPKIDKPDSLTRKDDASIR